ncbi:hypothetical protein [Streptomyces sp. NPDC058964]|uniref:hypothetical protein n=1 Tax=Streptomyces sp. NPDC058964 TaxID=3346681 RepID=UPI0036C09C2C
MRGRTRLPAFPEQVVLENAAFALGLRPTSIHTVLVPVWRVEVRATVTEGQPYELIDRFVERGIAEGGFHCAGELASFLALEPALVRQALAFLIAIDHVRDDDGRLALTELGRRSLRDGTRYTVTRDDRRKLYFDGFQSRPLTAAHYRSATVSFVSADEAVPRRRGGAPAPRLMPRAFRPGAVTELAGHPHRARFNLPAGIDDPECVGVPECVHLPAYAVRAVEDDGRVRHLVYTRAHGGEHDPDLSAACEGTPEFETALWAEESRAAGRLAERIERWLSTKELGQYRPVRDPHGAWRVTLPPNRFREGGAVELADVGSYRVLGGPFFQLWCADRDTRAWALVERLDSYVGARLRHDPVDIRMRIDALCRQLELGPVGMETLCRAADQAGKETLAQRLRWARSVESKDADRKVT